MRKHGELEIETDVLIIGGGASGCFAAIYAKMQGVDVTLVEKAHIDASGDAGAGNDHFYANLNSGPDWDTDEVIARSGFLRGETSQMEYKKRLAVLRKIPEVRQHLEKLGIDFWKDPQTGEYMRTKSFGMQGPLWMMIKNGKELKRKISDEVRRVGVTVVNRVMITSLLTNGGQVVGAVGFNVRNGDFHIFKAKSVIFATGEATRLYSNNSTNNPFNTWDSPFNAGSISLAARVGIKLVGTEFPMVTIIPKGFGSPGVNALVGNGCHFVNSEGERYMFKHSETGENSARSLLITATLKEIREGRGPCYCDCRHLEDDKREFLRNNLLSLDKDTYNDYLEQKSIDLGKDLMEVEVSSLEGIGALYINENLESNAEGVYAVGRAGRLGMLSWAFASGIIAGTNAAKYAQQRKQVPTIDKKQVVDEKEKIFAPLYRKKGYTPREFEDILHNIMNYYVAFERNEVGLTAAMKKLKLLTEVIDQIKAETYHEVMRAMEAQSLLEFAQLSTKAALERKETRGTHNRTDYPQSNQPEWNTHICVWKEDNEIQASFEKM